MRAHTASRAVPLLILMAAVGCGGASSPGGPSGLPTAAPPAAASPSPVPSPAASILRTAAIRGANGHSASGTARIVKEGSGYVLELGSDFRIDSGNNDVYLTRQPGTRTNADLNLGSMRQLTGEQRYTLPDDGGAFSHVMLWCRPFQVPIGLGELR
jgi:hypothetical protein